MTAGSDFKDDGRIRLLIIVGTRPEIIRLAAVINRARRYFDTLLAHTGQNYDYNLNGIFFRDLKLEEATSSTPATSSWQPPSPTPCWSSGTPTPA